ncbi:hypothetical protein [Streptacidiphilus albus]|uniref:hypothetical protein n=1 Tax=Streptacidiphilus albus TaxID=105425 RepID=UPI0018CD5F7D|nr:hypothetical protein [Streptacidiphilus albus]
MAATMASAAALLLLSACGADGLAGKIEDYDSVSVWPSADPVGQQPTGELTTLAPVTVECYAAGQVDSNGMGYGASYKISYDGGSGYIDAGTSILSDKGEVSPGMVPAC